MLSKDEDMMKNVAGKNYYFRKVSVVGMYFKRKCRTKQTPLSSDE